MHPLDHAREVMRRLRNRTDTVAVAYSGGKDSMVLLDLCVEYIPNVHPFFLYLVKDISFIEANLRWVKARYGLDVRQYPHPDLARLLGQSVYRRPSNVAEGVGTMKFSHIDKAVRYDTGAQWIAYGWKRADSLPRRGVLKHLEMHAFAPEGPRVYPLAELKTPHVLGYIKARKMPQPTVLGSQRMSGITLVPADLMAIHDQYPKDFAKIRKIFPFCDGVVARERERQAAKVAERMAKEQAKKIEREQKNVSTTIPQ